MTSEPVPPAIDPTERLLRLASLVGAARARRRACASRAISRGRSTHLLDRGGRAGAAAGGGRRDARTCGPLGEIARKAQLICEIWPQMLASTARSISPSAATGCSTRSPNAGRASRRPASPWPPASPPRPRPWRRWSRGSPGCPKGWSCCPGLWLPNSFPRTNGMRSDRTRTGRGEATHPQFHLKLLLDRIGVGRERGSALALVRTRRVAAGARARGRECYGGAGFSHKWETLRPAERRLSGIRACRACRSGRRSAGDCAGAARGAGDAGQDRGSGHARPPARGRAFRHCCALGNRGRRQRRASRCRRSPPARCCLALLGAAAEDLAPVPLLALLKHPLVGGEGEGRLDWLDAVRSLDLALRGPRPAAGLAGLDAKFAAKAVMRAMAARSVTASQRSMDCCASRSRLSRLCGNRWRGGASSRRRRRLGGPEGRMAAELLAELQASAAAAAAGQRRRCRAAPSPAARRTRGAAALWRAPAHLHLGPARSAASARRPGGPRRPQRRRVAGAAGA